MSMRWIIRHQSPLELETNFHSIHEHTVFSLYSPFCHEIKKRILLIVALVRGSIGWSSKTTARISTRVSKPHGTGACPSWRLTRATAFQCWRWRTICETSFHLTTTSRNWWMSPFSRWYPRCSPTPMPIYTATVSNAPFKVTHRTNWIVQTNEIRSPERLIFVLHWNHRWAVDSGIVQVTVVTWQRLVELLDF